MGVSYDKAAKEEAKRRNQKLATISVAGLVFQGPVSSDEERKLVRVFMDFQDERQKNPQAPLPPLPPQPPTPAVALP